MRLTRRGLMATLCASLAACANVSSNYKLDPNGKGLLIGSLTTDLGQSLYALELVSQDTGKPVAGPMTGSAMSPAIPPMRDADLGKDGGLFAVDLAPGRYAFRGWKVRRGYKDYGPTVPFEVPFVIESGKATYLGNVHWPGNWRITLSDQAERDLPLLKRRYATLVEAPLAFAIEPGASIVGLGGTASISMQIPVILPIPIKR